MAEKNEKQVKRRWTAVAVAAPDISRKQWWLANILGIVLLSMAALQIISIKEFEENFGIQGINNVRLLAALVIGAELWAAAGFFQMKLSPLFRRFSYALALIVGMFWLIWESYLNSQVFGFSANFFGKYLSQVPGFGAVV